MPAVAPGGFLGGIWAWTFNKQAELHRGLIDAVKGMKTGGIWRATWLLMAVSFGYGIFHAAGPGHGKAVVASYVLADGKTVRRGIALAFLAALMQALSALIVVAILLGLVGATGLQIKATEAWLETASWALVALLGAWLLFGQVRPLLARRAAAGDPGHVHAHTHERAAHTHGGHDHHHDHGHHHASGPSHTHDSAHAHDPAHTHDHAGHDDCATCGHAHMPDPAALADGSWSWRRALGLAVSIGIRPCTGAILVLIFAIGQGLAWAGVLATFAMALGTAITVSALAAVAVGSRTWSMKLAGAHNQTWAPRVESFARFAGAFLVFGLGLSFFFASLSGTSGL